MGSFEGPGDGGYNKYPGNYQQSQYPRQPPPQQQQYYNSPPQWNNNGPQSWDPYPQYILDRMIHLISSILQVCK